MEETLGERVRRLRKARGWTQVDLAYNADRAPSVVSQVETGKREPELSTIRQLAQALEVDWRYLLLGDQLPKAPAPNTPGRPDAKEGTTPEDSPLVSLQVLLGRMTAAGVTARQAIREWQRATALSRGKREPLTSLRVLEMCSLYLELSRQYMGNFNALLRGTQEGILGVIDDGTRQYLSPDPSKWPRELKEPLYEAADKIAQLPPLIEKIKLEMAEDWQGVAEQAMYEEFDVKRVELQKAQTEVGV